MRRKLATFFSIGVLFFSLCDHVSAQGVDWVDLREYIAGMPLVGHSHTLSTGEDISYELAPNDDKGGGTTIRMHKGGNHEQFVVRGTGIYRREDTSWAPGVGFSAVYCDSGERAVYTLAPGCVSFGDGVNVEDYYVNGDGAFWAPTTAYIPHGWSLPAHQIIPIRETVDPNRIACISAEAAPFASCGITWGLTVSPLYGPGEYTFCTGITNEAPLIEITTDIGEVFLFMRGWGFVGFEAPGFESGLMGPGADASLCESGDDVNSPIEFSGTLRTTRRIVMPSGNVLVNQPIYGATIVAYDGWPDFRTGKRDGLISAGRSGGISPPLASTYTDEYGHFELEVDRIGYENSNYIVVLCGGDVVEIYKATLEGHDISEGAYENMYSNINLQVDCGVDNEPIPEGDVPGSVAYALRSLFLNCFPENILNGGVWRFPHIMPQILLLFLDHTYDGVNPQDATTRVSDPNDPAFDPNYVPVSREAAGRLEGRSGLSNVMVNLQRLISNLCIFGGCPDGELTPPTTGEEMPLVDCDFWFEANQNLGTDRNTLISQGPFQNLAMPAAGSVGLSTTGGDAYAPVGLDAGVPNNLEVFYAHSDPDMEVCIHNGQRVRLGQIEAPTTWDTDAPCEGSSACVLDAQYFPYSRILGIPTAAQIKFESEASNDSWSWSPRQYEVPNGTPPESAHWPFGSHPTASYPEGQWSRSFSDMIAVATTALISTPVHMFGQTGGPLPGSVDPEITGSMRRVGRGLWRMGVMDGNLCSMEETYEAPTFEPFNIFNSFLPDDPQDPALEEHYNAAYPEAYKYITAATETDYINTLYRPPQGRNVINVLWDTLVNWVQAIFNINNNDDRYDQPDYWTATFNYDRDAIQDCLATNYDEIGRIWIDEDCALIQGEDDPDTGEEVWNEVCLCDLEFEGSTCDPDVEPDCWTDCPAPYTESGVHDLWQPDVAADNNDPPADFWTSCSIDGRQCTWERGTPSRSGSDECAGQIEIPFEARVQATIPYDEDGANATKWVKSFYDPFMETEQVGNLLQVDYSASNAADAPHMPGWGHDMAGGQDSVYWNSMMRMYVGDPNSMDPEVMHASIPSARSWGDKLAGEEYEQSRPLSQEVSPSNALTSFNP